MAKKLDQVTVKRLKSIGVSAKTEEEAREALLEIMKKSGVDGMESEDLDSLIDIAEAFVDDDVKGGDDDNGAETEPTEEEEVEELANEVEEEEAETEEPEETEEEEGDEFDEMDRSQLKAYIKENGLDVKVMKKWDDDTLREAIREAIGAAEEDMGETEEETEEEEQKPQPKKKAAPVTAKEKKEEKKAEAKTETKKKAVDAEKKPTKKRGVKLDPKKNADDRKEFGALQKLFPESDFEYAWLATAGVTVKHKGANGNRSIITIENCSKQNDGSIKCNVYLLTFTKQKELLDEAGVEYEPCWNGAPSIKGITLDEVIEIVSGFMDNILASVKKIDKKLGENRKKMEENLAKKTTSKKPVAKKAADDEEEEEETPKKKTPAKKTPKK